MTKKKTVFLAISFLLATALAGQVSPPRHAAKPVRDKPLPGAPMITALLINNGAAETRGLEVGLAFETSAGWWQWRYRVSYPGREGAFSEWYRRPVAWPVHARLADTPLPQRVCVQVQTDKGALSNECCAGITYVFDVEATLNAADIYNSSGGNSRTKMLACDWGSVSALLVESPALVVRVGFDSGSFPGAGPHNPAGTKCEWAIFENLRLKPGWRFVSANYAFVQQGQGEKKTGITFLLQPAVGGRDVGFKVRVWANSLFTARFQLNSLKVVGPSNQEVFSGGLIQVLE
jgi:hypothetical protein